MSAPDDLHGPRENRLLAALPREDYERLLAKLDMVSLAIKQIVYEPNGPIPHVYFPTSAVTSVISIMEDGVGVEVATVGNEGMVGLPLFLGAATTPLQAFCQVPGAAARLKADVFRDEIDRGSPLHGLLQRYTQALLNQIAQSAACNRVHSIDQRCARWLLMTHDRVRADQFLLTQEFLAQMLGVRRASVNTAAGMLQKAGFIRYTRGRITVTDRPGLESASCECYRIIKEDFDRLLGQARG